jgi:hypothetical protein
MHGDSQVRPGESSGGEHEAKQTRTPVCFNAVRRIGTNVANDTSPSNVQHPPRIGDLSGKLLTTGTGNEIQPAHRAVAIACSAVNNTLLCSSAVVGWVPAAGFAARSSGGVLSGCVKEGLVR